MASDQQPDKQQPNKQQSDKLRLVADPDQRLEASDSDDEPRSQREGSQRENEWMADNPDEDIRIRRIGSVDPMEELSDFDEDEETAYDIDDDDEDVEEAPRGRLLPITTAVLALLGFAGIIWYAYQWGAGSVAPEELPVIRAEAGSSKIRPESPGGLEVPYQETLALNDLQPDPAKPQVERLLPPPETPLPPEAPAPETAALPEAAAPTTPETPTPETTPAPAVAAVPPAPTTPPAPAISSTPEVPEPPAAAQTPAVPAPTTKTSAVPANGFVLQLASLKAKERASGEWSRLQKSFPGLLADRQLVVLSVDLAGRGTFYRVQAGYFPDRASAEAACKQLKAKRQDCLVTKR